MDAPIISMIESASVVTLAIVFARFLGDRLNQLFWRKNLAFSVVFSAIGLISMSSPVALAPGVVVDARNVVTAMSAAIGGPVSVVITAASLVTMRLSAGGAGAVLGATTISLVALSSLLLLAWLRYRRQGRFGYGAALILAAAAALCPMLVLSALGGALGLSLGLQALAYSVPTNFFGVLLFCALYISEEQRRWALLAYADAQDQFKNLADNAPGVLFQLQLITEGEIRFKYISGGAQSYFTASPAEITEDASIVTNMLSNASRVKMDQSLRQSYETHGPWNLEVEFQPGGSETRWMRVAAAKPRRDMDGRLIWDGSLFDITEQKRNEQMKNEFISTVSHELRTPLTSIRGSLGLISGGTAGELPARAAALVKIANTNAERLVRLINDILDIEKIESGNMPFRPKVLALFPIVKQSTDASRDYLADRGVIISVEEEKRNIRAHVDPDRMYQVMNNLLSNAIKYSPENGEVRVNISRNEDFARIAVSDSGPGIPEAFRARIFNKFEQADGSATKAVGGTGLGLSIVKAILDRLGGKISYETEIGAGTTFFVDLPAIAEEPSSAETRDKNHGEESRSATSDLNVRILICEDEPDIAAVIANMLRENNVESDIALNIETALKHLSERSYDAMTLDVRLAGESGVDLYKQIRLMPEHRDLPIIVISAVVDEARTTLNGSALGVVDWLSKPIDTERLSQAVKRVRKGNFRRRPSVLHIEDDDDVVKIISASLGDAVSFDFAKSISDARAKLNHNNYDLVILDLELTDGSGVELLNDIPSDASVVIFSATDVSSELAGKVEAAMTKTKTSELAISALVKSLAEKRMNARASLDNPEEG